MTVLHNYTGHQIILKEEDCKSGKLIEVDGYINLNGTKVSTDANISGRRIPVVDERITISGLPDRIYSEVKDLPFKVDKKDLGEEHLFIVNEEVCNYVNRDDFIVPVIKGEYRGILMVDSFRRRTYIHKFENK